MGRQVAGPALVQIWELSAAAAATGQGTCPGWRWGCAWMAAFAGTVSGSPAVLTVKGAVSPQEMCNRVGSHVGTAHFQGQDLGSCFRFRFLCASAASALLRWQWPAGQCRS